MKIICTSDWHADSVTLGVRRYDEIAANIIYTVQEAIAQRVDLYTFTGDLCDPDSGVSVFRCVQLALQAAMMLREARIPSVWLAGNHDVIEDGSGDTTLTPLRAVQDSYVCVAERPQMLRGHILALPFAATSHDYNPGEWLKHPPLEADNRGLPLIVLSHLSVAGIEPGEETTEMPRGRNMVLPLDLLPSTRKRTVVIQGHYHKQQVFKASGVLPIYVPGAVARLTFGEQDYDPGYMLLEVNP